MKFVECPRIRDYHTSDSEKAAIIKEVFDENPSAFHVEVVEGGVKVFYSNDEYETWLKQT